MARKPASAWETGGGGTTFERQVAASYLLAMLESRQPFPERGGTIVEIRFQVRSEGWLFDDVLLILNGRETWHAAISIKSGDLFATDTWAESLSDAWEMLEGAGPFTVGRDRYVVETSTLASKSGRALKTLCSLAAAMESSTLNQRILSSDSTLSKYDRDFYADRCARPGKDSADISASKFPADFLRHLVLRTQDFRNAESDSISQMLSRCRELLEAADDSAARKLWDALFAIVSDLSPRSGTIRREALVSQLKPHHRLRDAPDVRDDFTLLERWSNERRQSVVTTIGEMRVAREGLGKHLLLAVKTHAICVIAGPSGAGKTVAALSACTGIGAESVLFIRAEDIRTNNWDRMIERLHHPLERILRLTPVRVGAIIIDGCEVIDSPPLLEALGRLIRGLENANQDGAWRLIITLQDQSLPQLLPAVFVDPNEIAVERVGLLDDEDMAFVASGIPNLNRLLRKDRLAPIFRYPKILDIIARHAEFAAELDGGPQTTELDVFKWYWNRVVRFLQPVEVQALLLLATHQGDRGEQYSPLTNLPPQCAQAIPAAQRAGICRTDEWGSVSFSHDLISEWIRLGALLAQQNNAEAWAEARLVSVRWRPAIRLWMQYRLEFDGFDPWRALWVRGEIWQDLALDGLIQSQSARVALDALWPSLIDDQGMPLQRFLRRFLQSATVPDARWVETLSRMGTMGVELQVMLRTPIPELWPPVVGLLSAHLVEAIPTAADDIAKLATRWLRQMAMNSPLTVQVVSMALAAARHAWSTHVSREHGGLDVRTPCYQALMMAYPAARKPVVHVLRLLAGRRLPDRDDPLVKPHFYTAPGQLTHLHTSFGTCHVPMPEPWPDGPLYRINDEFRNFVYYGGAIPLETLMRHDPEVAAEVLLAAAVVEPRPIDPVEECNRFKHNIDHAGLAYFREHSGHPSSGSWWIFLTISPQAALVALIRLVDFNTQRALDAYAGDRYIASARSVLTLIIKGRRVDFIGTKRMLDWHLGHWAHPIVVMALMGLERHLYDLIEKKADLGPIITALLAQGRSAAFLGVMWDIARYQPILVREQLRPLISCAELHDWELRSQVSQLHRIGGYSPCADEAEFKQGQAWINMPHREIELRELIVRMFIIDPPDPDFYAQARILWTEIRSTLSNEDPEVNTLELLIARFTEDNYARSEVDERIQFEFVPPPALRVRMEEEGQAANDRIFANNVMATCAQMLEGGPKRPAPEVLHATMSKLQAVSLTTKAEPASEEGETNDAERNRYAAIIGCAAALYCCYPGWVDAHPEEERQCRIWARLATRHVVPDQAQFIEHDTSTMSPEALAAATAAAMATRAPTRTCGLLLMGQLCHTLRGASSGNVFGEAWRHREKLGEQLFLLLSCLIISARARRAHRRREQEKRWQDKDKANMEFFEQEFVAARANAHSAWIDFLDGRGDSNAVTTWADKAVSSGVMKELGMKRGMHVLGSLPEKNQEQSRYRLDLGIETHWLLTATVPHVRPSGIGDSTTRIRWCRFLDQALVAVIAELQSYDTLGRPIKESDNDDERETPYPYQLQVINVCARETLLVEDDEIAFNWWRRMLSSTCRLNCALKSWFESIVRTSVAEKFDGRAARRWSKMIEDLARSDGMQFPRLRWNALRVWRAALGFPESAAKSYWNESTLPILLEHEVTLRAFFQYCMKISHEAQWLLRLAQDDSARPLRTMICESAITDVKLRDTWWWENNIADDLARFLLEYISVDLQPLQRHRETRKQCQPLVAALAARQHPLAEDLLNMINQA